MKLFFFPLILFINYVILFSKKNIVIPPEMSVKDHLVIPESLVKFVVTIITILLRIAAVGIGTIIIVRLQHQNVVRAKQNQYLVVYPDLHITEMKINRNCLHG